MQQYVKKLKEGGYKLTPRRKAIIRLFSECGTHMTPEEVLNKLKKTFSRCGFPGVYRNLESLVGCGILTRIQKFDRKKHYGLCPAGQEKHHHHINCIRCGKLEVIDECAISGINEIKGYRVISHFLQVEGICAKCANE